METTQEATVTRYITLSYEVSDERPRPVLAAVEHTNRSNAIADARQLVGATRAGTRKGAGTLASTGLGIVYQARQGRTWGIVIDRNKAAADATRREAQLAAARQGRMQDGTPLSAETAALIVEYATRDLAELAHRLAAVAA